MFNITNLKLYLNTSQTETFQQKQIKSTDKNVNPTLDGGGNTMLPKDICLPKHG